MNFRDASQTQKISLFVAKERKVQVRSIMENVYHALEEKGYDPVIQIVGYFLSGDPTYITAHNNARSQIGRLERDELLEEILYYYLGFTK